MRYIRAEQARLYKRERPNEKADVQRFRQIYDRFGAHFAEPKELDDIALVHALVVGKSVDLYGVRYTRLANQPLRDIPRIPATGMCGCCGGEAAFRANVRGADGVYFPRLCRHCFDDFVEDGYFDINDAQLTVLGDLLGDDLDGIESMMA